MRWQELLVISIRTALKDKFLILCKVKSYQLLKRGFDNTALSDEIGTGQQTKLPMAVLDP